MIHDLDFFEVQIDNLHKIFSVLRNKREYEKSRNERDERTLRWDMKLMRDKLLYLFNHNKMVFTKDPNKMKKVILTAVDPDIEEIGPTEDTMHLSIRDWYEYHARRGYFDEYPLNRLKEVLFGVPSDIRKLDQFDIIFDALEAPENEIVAGISKMAMNSNSPIGLKVIEEKIDTALGGVYRKVDQMADKIITDIPVGKIMTPVAKLGVRFLAEKVKGKINNVFYQGEK